MDESAPSRLLSEANRVLIVANPKAGAGSGRSRTERLAAALTKQRFAVEIVWDLTEIGPRAADAQQSGRLRAVVAAGGDGTVCELVNRTPPGVPITMLPLGTENLLAKYIDMPRSPEEVAEVIAAGTVVRHDVGQASGRLFVLMVSCGFDAEVVRRLHEQRNGHIHHWSYFKPIWQTIRSYEYPEIRIYYEPEAAGGPAGRSFVPVRFAFVFNVPRYAMNFQFAPGAIGDDGLLDVCTFRQGSFPYGLWYLINVILKSHPRIADCSITRARRLRIESDGPVPYNLDGDHGGYLPLDIEVLPNRLTLLVPPGWIKRHPPTAAASAASTTDY